MLKRVFRGALMRMKAVAQKKEYGKIMTVVRNMLQPEAYLKFFRKGGGDLRQFGLTCRHEKNSAACFFNNL